MKLNVLKLTLAVLLSTVTLEQSHAGACFIFPTTQENQGIDALLEKAEKQKDLEHFDEALILYEKVIQESTKENYSKGLTKGYLGASLILFTQKKLDKSTEYLVKAKDEAYAKENPEEMGRIHFREGLNLHVMGLYDQAIRRYKESIKISEKIKDKDRKNNQIYKAYNNIGDVFQLKNKHDSAMFYYRVAYKSPTKDIQNKFYSSVSLYDLFLEGNQVDSAQFYLSQAERYAKEINTTSTEATMAYYKGKLFDFKGQYDSAIAYYQTSFKLKKSLNQLDPGLLKRLSEVYGKMGNENEANRYLANYVSLNDSLKAANFNNVQVPVILAKDYAQSKLKTAESQTKILLIVLGIALFAIGILVYLYIKKQKKRMVYRKVENNQLKKKLNSAFEEVAELAQINSPNFLSRFIEVYPEFYNYLVSTYPDLTNADLKLCALMKLDYSTKEIAEITYSSIRTVQNRKYKLRKKFNLSPDDNLNLWIQNLHIQSLNLV